MMSYIYADCFITITTRLSIWATTRNDLLLSELMLCSLCICVGMGRLFDIIYDIMDWLSLSYA